MRSRWLSLEDCSTEDCPVVCSRPTSGSTRRADAWFSGGVERLACEHANGSSGRRAAIGQLRPLTIAMESGYSPIFYLRGDGCRCDLTEAAFLSARHVALANIALIAADASRSSGSPGLLRHRTAFTAMPDGGGPIGIRARSIPSRK